MVYNRSSYDNILMIWEWILIGFYFAGILKSLFYTTFILWKEQLKKNLFEFRVINPRSPNWSLFHMTCGQQCLRLWHLGWIRSLNNTIKCDLLGERNKQQTLDWLIPLKHYAQFFFTLVDLVLFPRAWLDLVLRNWVLKACKM